MLLRIALLLLLLAPMHAFQGTLEWPQSHSLRHWSSMQACKTRQHLGFRVGTTTSQRLCRPGGDKGQGTSLPHDERVGDERWLAEVERRFQDRIADIAPSMIKALDEGPGAIAVVDNLLGPEHVAAMRREAVAVTERGLLKGSASAYTTAPPETYEERYGDEPGISASVLTAGTKPGDLAPTCRAYIAAASSALAAHLGAARRGKMDPAEFEGGATDHQLRLTTVAQQVHMDNSFDGVNRRLLTTIYYLNPDWQPEYGGRFLPWPCSDAAATQGAREATLPSTILGFDDLPWDAQLQIPPKARSDIRVSISRRMAPTAEYEACMTQSRKAQPPLDPVGDRLIAFYADELLHSVEPVALHPLIRDGDSIRVHDAARFAISLWLHAPTIDAILPENPAHEWLSLLTDPEGSDPIGGKLHIEMIPGGAKGGGEQVGAGDKAKGSGFGVGVSKGGNKKGSRKMGRK